MSPAPAYSKTISILIAEDDPDDRDLARDALNASEFSNSLRFVEDGEELLEYLSATGRYASLEQAPTPGLILLDLNMPRKDGREALKEIKSHPMLRKIPVVVLTTSRADEDIVRTYDLGVNSYIPKPVTFEGLVEVMRTLHKYWFETVALPHNA